MSARESPLAEEPDSARRPALRVRRGRKLTLVPELVERICSYIEQGAYDWVAATACGVHKSTFYRWLERGRTARSGIYREFLDKVQSARAQARLDAEIAVRREDPKFWLRCGPGKERPGEPGWTESAKFVPPTTAVSAEESAQEERLEALRTLTKEERKQLRELLDALKKLYETAEKRLTARSRSSQQGVSTAANGTRAQN